VRKISTELQHLIWEETFSQQWVFDDDTLRLLNPQNGMMYSYLTMHSAPQSQLPLPIMAELRRVIYFNPEYTYNITILEDSRTEL
jgi:hypothetical protein